MQQRTTYSTDVSYVGDSCHSNGITLKCDTKKTSSILFHCCLLGLAKRRVQAKVFEGRYPSPGGR